MRGPARFAFDFISPYSYLASALIEKEPRYAALPIEYAPVVFGTILARNQARGPGEIPTRRRIGLQDVVLLARYYGLPFLGPPTHPFNSVYALRSICAVTEQKLRARLTARYFRAAWGEGKNLEDLSVLRAILEELGIDQDPEEAATTREHRAALKANTESLLEAGGFGVPTFLVDGLVFFGHDRLPLLAAYLEGSLDHDPEAVETMLARPQPGRIV